MGMATALDLYLPEARTNEDNVDVVFEKINAVTVASIAGRLDGVSSPQVERALIGQLDANRLILDISGLNYISSAGLRVILMVAKRLKQIGSTFTIVGIQPHIQELFEISGFLTIIDTARSRDEALC
ncbi:STAS domain-containing protein [Rhizobium sp. LjRoot30]|uniref:STAS domain-containing protein n=1 Tax=Rhizobium sp. LjRoot30 TaxID=3342320 RepID=UPI003ECCD494